MQQVVLRPLGVPEFAWIRSVEARGDAWLEVTWATTPDGYDPNAGAVLVPPMTDLPVTPPKPGDLVWLRDDGSIRSWTDRHDGRLPEDPKTLAGPVLLAVVPGDTVTVTRFENPAGGALPFPRAFEEIRQMMIEKRPSKGDAWRGQPVALHVARMSIHAARANAGANAEPGPDDDLVHAVVRGLMALERRAEARARLAADGAS